MSYTLQNKWFSIQEAQDVLKNGQEITLSDELLKNIQKSRSFLDQKTKDGQSYYGINTGFGSLYNQSIQGDQLLQLQVNLLRSHACGMGEYVPQEIIRLMLLSKVKSLSLGYSGVQTETVQRLLFFLNNDILPVIYNQGSLGASGDLAPLAHLSLPLIGEGEVWVNNKIVPVSEVYKQHNLKPITLQTKEGLALINGTQFILAYGIYCLQKFEHLLAWADVISALSIDAFHANLVPFNEGLMNIRPHDGQVETSATIRTLLKDSEIQKKAKKELQDPYSFRCIPQVHGAIKDAYKHILSVFEKELNSVTDNPTLFIEEDAILSGGNFHAEPLALPLDYLGIAMSELASISERRVYKLISGQRNLPPFLVSQPGINSGFMIAQYTAASIVSQNKQLATPASVDTIDSSNGQEDHVSMGANAATKCLRVLENVEKVLAIELFTAAQALEFRRPLKSSSQIEKIMNNYRKVVPFIEEDTYMQPLLQKSIEFIQTNKI